MRGQNLVEFAVIIAVVGIVSIAALVLLGNNTNETYNKSSSKYGEFKPFEFKNDGNNEIEIVPGSLGGSVNKPISQCSGNSCDIDFGGLVLKNVPLNFSEYVKLNGTGGGSDKIAALLEQIAESLKAKGDDTGYEQYKKLANIGHLMAAVQAKAESVGKQCGTHAIDSTQDLCITENLDTSWDIEMPEIVRNSMGSFPENTKLATLVSGTRLDLIRASVMDPNCGGQTDCTVQTISNIGSSGPSMKLEDTPAYHFINTFDDIMKNPNYNEEIKGLTKECYLMISDLSRDISERVANAQSGQAIDVYYDPLSGKELNITPEIPHANNIMDPVGMLTTPQISTGTNFQSSLICAAGSNKDTGTECHK